MEINFFQIIFQIVNFTILLFLLRKYLYKPILKILEGRAKKIHEGLEAAEKSIEEREKLEKQEKKMLVDAEKSATKILEGTRIRAKKLEKSLVEKSEKEIDKKFKKSEVLSKSKLEQMEQELSRKFNQAVISTSESLLKNTIGVKEQREIIKRQINKLREIKFA